MRTHRRCDIEEDTRRRRRSRQTDKKTKKSAGIVPSNHYAFQKVVWNQNDKEENQIQGEG